MNTIHELRGGNNESGRRCRVASIGLFQLAVCGEDRS
jgi:hypothetical protein